MKRNGYGRTDLTKSIIGKAKRVLEKMKAQNPNMSWQERNVVINEMVKKYESEFMFQPIMFSDSVCKWWKNKYR
jgi:hypothetical protein